jgi:superfamily II DNA or RNA helicase
MNASKRDRPTPMTLRQIGTFLAERIGEGLWPGICFVKTKKRAEELAKHISYYTGRETPVVTGDTPKLARKELSEAMTRRDPDYPVAITPGAWSTGVDIPALRWVGFCDLGQAPIWAIQSAGRGSRKDGKDKHEFFIYDFGATEDADARAGHTNGYCGSDTPDPHSLQWVVDTKPPAASWKNEDQAFLEELMEYNAADAEASQDRRQQHNPPHPQEMPWWVGLGILWLIGLALWMFITGDCS